ncbi:MAG: hypothetical protein P8R42_12365 [Candidatus Binatia bacterium]|nr:hypothetical protein [Candidatus Binatia bacterium]
MKDRLNAVTVVRAESALAAADAADRSEAHFTGPLHRPAAKPPRL